MRGIDSTDFRGTPSARADYMANVRDLALQCVAEQHVTGGNVAVPHCVGVNERQATGNIDKKTCSQL